MKTPNINLYKYNKFGIEFYGYENIYDGNVDYEWDSQIGDFVYFYYDENQQKVYVDGKYYYYSDTTGERIYEKSPYNWHFFLDKTDVHYFDLYEYITEHGRFEIPFTVTFVCDFDPSGNTYDLDWGEYDYDPSEWYEYQNKYEATFTIHANVENGDWTFKYPKDWKIKSMYEFHKEGSSGGSGSGSGGGDDPDVFLKTIDFRRADNLSNVISTSSMFEGCSKLSSVNFGNSTFTNLTSADYMFGNCKLINEGSIVLNNAITFANLASAYGMFYEDAVCGNTFTEKILSLLNNGTFYTDVEDVELRFIYNQVTYQINYNLRLEVVENPNTKITGAVTIPATITKSGFTLTVNSIMVSAFYKQYLMTSIQILSTNITKIRTYTFHHCTGLVSVALPNSITEISYMAFCDCTSLTTINMPTSLTTIGAEILNGSLITSITIPSSVTSIASDAFTGCNYLTSVTILTNSVSDSSLRYAGISFTSNDYVYSVDGKNKAMLTAIKNGLSKTSITLGTVTAGDTFAITKIGSHSFSECENLLSVVIPDSVTNIIEGAFSGCGKLLSMTLPEAGYENGSYYQPFGYIFGDEPYTGGVAVHQYYSDSSYTNKSITYYFPEYLNTVTVTRKIGKRAFEDHYSNSTALINLTNITIPSTQTSIGDGTFYQCVGLDSITIPSSVTSMGKEVFFGCSNLETVNNLENTSITVIDEDAFDRCTKLDSITLPPTLTTIGRRAFYDCGLKTLTIPDSVTLIDYRAFFGSGSLTSITVGKAIETITISQGFGDAFENCYNIKTITITNTATSIGASAFCGCTTITSVTIPNTVTSIGTEAFKGCSKLPSTTIPSTVLTIGTGAFTGVTHIYYSGSATWESGDTNWGATYLNGYLDNDFLYSDSTKTNLWCYFGNASSVSIPNTVTTIGSKAFSGKTSITSISIPSGVTSIGSYAFSGCENLTTLTGYSNLAITSIANGTFKNCKKLASITIPSTVTSIGNEAFYNCLLLGTLTIPSAVTTIGASAFAYCVELASLPNLGNTGITYISDSTFAYCSHILSIDIPSTVASIGLYAFRNCRAAITYPSSMTEIESYAFAESGVAISFTGSSVTTIKSNAFYNAQISSITIPSTVTTIESSAFSNCTNLKTIVIPSSVTSIGSNAFANSMLDSATINCSITSAAGLAIYHNGVDYTISSQTTVEVKRDNTTYPYVNITVEDFTAGNSFAVERCNLSSVSNLETLTFGTLTQMTRINVYGCHQLQRLVIPNTVTGLYSSNISGCNALTYLYVPSSVTLAEALTVFRGASYSFLTVDCQPSSKPSNWASNWVMGDNFTINWDVQTPQ